MHVKNYYGRLAALALAGALMLTGLGGCSRSGDSEKMQEAKKAGIEALSEGKYKTAVKKFNTALGASDGRIDGEEFDICYYKAAAQYSAGDFDGAIETYTALAGYDKQDPYPLFLRGSVYASKAELKHTEEDYGAALKRDPDNYELCIAMYENLEAKGHDKEAKKWLDRGLAIDGDEASDNLCRGRIYLLQKKYDEAEKSLKKAAADGDKKANVWLCRTYIAKGDDAAAQKTLYSYRKSSGLTAEDDQAIADLMMSLGDYQTASSYIESGLKSDKADAAVTQKLKSSEVVCLEHLDQYEKAAEKAKAYMKAYPSDTMMIRESAFIQNALTDYEPKEAE